MAKAWTKIFTRFSIGDISFFMLRLATILGGILWLSLAPLLRIVPSAPFTMNSKEPFR